MKKNFFIITEEFVNSRLDRWFRRNIFDIPQSLLEKSFRKGYIKVNQKKKNSSYKLKINDKISIFNLSFIAKKHKVKKYSLYTYKKRNIFFIKFIY